VPKSTNESARITTPKAHTGLRAGSTLYRTHPSSSPEARINVGVDSRHYTIVVSNRRRIIPTYTERRVSPSHPDCMVSLAVGCTRLADSSVVNKGDERDAEVCPTVSLPNPLQSCTHGTQRQPTDALSAAPTNCYGPITAETLSLSLSSSSIFIIIIIIITTQNANTKVWLHQAQLTLTIS